MTLLDPEPPAGFRRYVPGLASIAYGSRPGPVAVGGTVLAVVGVAVLFLGQGIG